MQIQTAQRSKLKQYKYNTVTFKAPHMAGKEHCLVSVKAVEMLNIFNHEKAKSSITGDLERTREAFPSKVQ